MTLLTNILKSSNYFSLKSKCIRVEIKLLRFVISGMSCGSVIQHLTSICKALDLILELDKKILTFYLRDIFLFS